MKKSILAKLAGSALALAFVSCLNAQNNNDVTLEGVKYLSANLSAGNAGKLENPSTPYAVDAHNRAIKDFKKSFKSASDERWTVPSDGFIACFTQAGIKTAVAYNKRGIWQHTIRYYGEQQLPTHVRAMVKKANFDSNINQVEEIEMSDKTIYLVHVEDQSSCKLIRVCDGEMQTLVDAKKG